jgi:hypothetical protein
MAKKEKEKPVLNLDGKEYVIEDMTDEQKMMVNHINDIQNKQASNSFVADQLRVGREAFINMLKKSLSKPKNHSPHDPGDENDS